MCKTLMYRILHYVIEWGPIRFGSSDTADNSPSSMDNSAWRSHQILPRIQHERTAKADAGYKQFRQEQDAARLAKLAADKASIEERARRKEADNIEQQLFIAAASAPRLRPGKQPLVNYLREAAPWPRCHY